MAHNQLAKAQRFWQDAGWSLLRPCSGVKAEMGAAGIYTVPMACMTDKQIPKRLIFDNFCNSDDRGPGRPHKSQQDCMRVDLAILGMQHNWEKVAQDFTRSMSNISKFPISSMHT